MPVEEITRRHLRVADAATSATALAHLLGVLDDTVRLLDEIGRDVDARVIEGHRAQLAAGHEWPGQPVAPIVFSDGSASGDIEDTACL